MSYPANPPVTLNDAYRTYLDEGQAHERAGNVDASWACLEAAHIIGQRVTYLHARAHLRMLQLAWRTRNSKEVLGQVKRLLAAWCVTWLWVPSGNSGRAHVSAVLREDIPSDLQRLLDAARADLDRRR
jgi:hypothetical protein